MKGTVEFRKICSEKCLAPKRVRKGFNVIMCVSAPTLSNVLVCLERRLGAVTTGSFEVCTVFPLVSFTKSYFRFAFV